MNTRFSTFLPIMARRSANAVTEPTDCVRQFPTLNPETTELVGFDARGTPRIRVEIPKDEDINEWSAWLLRWVRRRDRRAAIRLIG